MPCKTRKKVTLKTIISLSLLGGLSACGSIVDADILQSDIESYFAKKTGIGIQSVTCPEDVEFKEDTKFTCEVETVEGRRIKAYATVEGEKVKWNIKEGLLSFKKLEGFIKEEFAESQEVQVDADCGSKDIIAYKGDFVECTVSDSQNQNGIVKVVVIDNEGSVKIDDFSLVEKQT